MYYKNTQVGYEGIEIAYSDSVNGNFSIIGKIETDNRKEAPFLFLVNDKLRLYLDTYEGEGGITYKDMFYDLSYNKPIITKNISKKYKHCHLIDLTGWKWETNYNLEANFINLNEDISKDILDKTVAEVAPIIQKDEEKKEEQDDKKEENNTINEMTDTIEIDEIISKKSLFIIIFVLILLGVSIYIILKYF